MNINGSVLNFLRGKCSVQEHGDAKLCVIRADSLKSLTTSMRKAGLDGVCSSRSFRNFLTRFPMLVVKSDSEPEQQGCITEGPVVVNAIALPLQAAEKQGIAREYLVRFATGADSWIEWNDAHQRHVF